MARYCKGTSLRPFLRNPLIVSAPISFFSPLSKRLSQRACACCAPHPSALSLFRSCARRDKIRRVFALRRAGFGFQLRPIENSSAF